RPSDCAGRRGGALALADESLVLGSSFLVRPLVLGSWCVSPIPDQGLRTKDGLRTKAQEPRTIERQITSPQTPTQLHPRAHRETFPAAHRSGASACRARQSPSLTERRCTASRPP